MPTKQKKYGLTKFAPEVMKQAAAEMQVKFDSINVDVGDDTSWTFSVAEEADEGFSMYRSEDCNEASIVFYSSDLLSRLSVNYYRWRTVVNVRIAKRSAVEGVFSIFESHLQSARIPQQEIDKVRNAAFKIFIGHGKSALWRDLRDHLQDKHDYKVEAFETAPRSGRHVADILEGLEEDAGFAIMVMTGENESASGTLHARENVIHETGLFQGTLGLQKVIVLLEEGCQEFSNRAGVQYIPFSKGNIKEVFGEVIATIRREFG